MNIKIEGTRTKKSAANVVFGVGNRIVLMVFPFIIKTITIYTLGAEYLGLNSLFSSILQVLSLSELGVGSAMVYNMYRPLAEGDKKTVGALLLLYKKVYSYIGLFILVVGISLCPFLDKLIASSYPQDINIYILYLIFLLNTVLSYWLFAYKKSLLEANQVNSIESMLNTAVNFVLYIGQIIVLLLFKDYYLYIILMPICTAVLNVVRNIVVSRLFPEIKAEGKLDKAIIEDIKKKVFALFGHKIGTTIITSADSIVISAILGLVVLAQYSNYYYIINSLIGFVTIFYTAITASVGNSIVKDSVEKNYHDFKTLVFINSWIVGWCSICLYCLYQPFMKIWMGDDMLFGKGTLILFVVYFYVWLIRRIGLTYKDAAGMWNEDFLKPYVGAVINLVTNIILVKYIGVDGALLSTIIIMVLIYAPWETIVLFKNLFKSSPKEYIIRLIIYTLITVTLAVATDMFCNLVQLEGIVGLIIRIFICLVVPNIIYIVIYNRTEEFKESKLKLVGLIRRK